MAANLENSAVGTELEKVSFHYNQKERQRQRIFRLPQNCAPFTSQQGNAQNPSSWASTVHESRTSRYTTGLKKVEKPEIKSSTAVGSQKEQGNSRKTSMFASLTTLKLMWITTNCRKFLKRWEYQATLTAT